MATSLNASLNVQLNAQSLTQASKQVQQALGRITGKASEFQKSLDASTARVFAFGATTAVLNGVTQSFKKLVATTVEVEKKLIEINAIFQATASDFNKFRNAIFRVAKETGQAFNTVAEGAAELARQGLSAEETAKRLKAALVMTRVSGMDAEKSVKALTAAINGFTSEALTANQIVNKMVAVDTAFAVSTQDLAEAFSRAGSTAEDAGVSFNQLLGLVTAVEQKTARGGAVIGNAFKSIFTRLARGNTIGQLKELGVEIDATMSGVHKLQALSKAIEGISDPTVVSKIKELAGGVFQINVVSAALKDLSSETSIFKNAAMVAANASNQAFQKNAELNKSLAAQINTLVQGLTSLAEKVGKVTFGPLLANLVGIATKFSEFLDKALDPEKGNLFIKGLFKAIGSFLGGPAIILFTAAFFKIAKLIARFAAEGLKSLFAVGSQTERIKQIEGGIVGLLQRDSSLRKLITNTSASQLQKEQAIIQAIQRENSLLSQQANIMRGLATAAAARGVTGVTSSGAFTGKRGRRFSSGFRAEEAEAMMMGAPRNVRAKNSSGTIGGSKFIMNNKETEIPNFGRNGDSAVIPHYAGGFVPNYASFRLGGKGQAFSGAAMGKMNLTAKEKAQYVDEGGVPYKKGSKKRKSGLGFPYYNADAPDSQKALMLVPQKQALLPSALDTEFKEKRRLSTRFRGFQGSVAGIDPNLKQDSEFRRLLRLDQILDAALARGVNKALSATTEKSGGKLKMKPQKLTTAQVKARMKEGGEGAFGAIRGAVFEAIIDSVVGNITADHDKTLDVDIGSNPVVEEIFGIKNKGYKWGDFKNSQGQKDKFIKQTMRNLPRAGAPRTGKAKGFVPNYNARRGYGVPPSKIRVHRDSMGEPLAVTNTRDEPRGLRDAIGREKKGIGMYAGGFVPNYFDPDDYIRSKGAGGRAVYTRRPAQEQITVRDRTGSFVPMGQEAKPKKVVSSSTETDGKTKGGGGKGAALMMGLMGLQTAIGMVTSKHQEQIPVLEKEHAANIKAIRSQDHSFSARQKLIKAENAALAKKKEEIPVMDQLMNAANACATALMAISTMNMLTGGGMKTGAARLLGFGGKGKFTGGVGKQFAKAKTLKQAGSTGKAAKALAKGGGKLAGRLGVLGVLGAGAFDAFSTMKDDSLHKSQKSERLKKTGIKTGMTAAGAALGTLIPIPVVGTLVGGFIGNALGNLMTEGKLWGSAESEADKKVAEATSKGQKGAMDEARIGFTESGFESAVNQNLKALQKDGHDTTGLEEEYNEALALRAEGLKEADLAEGESKEEKAERQKGLDAAEKRLIIASMKLSGQRFHDAKARKKNNDLINNTESGLRVATRKLAYATQNLAIHRKDMVDKAQKAHDQAGLQASLGTSISGPFAGAVNLAAQQDLTMKGVALKQAESGAAQIALDEAKAKGADPEEIAELKKAREAAGQEFVKAVRSAGANFKNTIKKTEDLIKKNKEAQAEEARGRMNTSADRIGAIMSGKVSGDTSGAEAAIKSLMKTDDSITARGDRRGRWGGDATMTKAEILELEEQYHDYLDSMKRIGYTTKEANKALKGVDPDLYNKLQENTAARSAATRNAGDNKFLTEGVFAGIDKDRGMTAGKAAEELIEAEANLATELRLTQGAFKNLREMAPNTVKNIEKTQKVMMKAAESVEEVNKFAATLAEQTKTSSNAIIENQTVITKLRNVVETQTEKVDELEKLLKGAKNATDINTL
jgi:TP901 family phage tail tape measure protein